MERPVSHVDGGVTRRGCLLAGAGACAAFLLPSTPARAQSRAALEPKELDDLLESVRKKFDVPALAAAIVQDGKYALGGAAGFRKDGNPTRATIQDKFHIGSMTKSMTSTLIALYYEEGKLRWETTIGQTFPELAASMRPEYRNVTFRHLLSHHGGMPAETYPKNFDPWRLPDNFKEPRLDYVRHALQEPSEAPVGTKMIYANRGYIIAGAMLERIAGDLWENLMTKRLFVPLGMKSAGFGAAGRVGKIEQPYPHSVEKGKHVAVPPDLHGDNAPVLGPAGRVHVSLPDLAKYVILHLQGERGADTLLKSATVKRLHTPPFEGEYAFGWGRVAREWGGGPVLNHSGSNTMNYAVMWLAPERDFAALIAANQGGDAAEAACDAVAGVLVTRLAQAFHA